MLSAALEQLDTDEYGEVDTDQHSEHDYHDLWCAIQEQAEDDGGIGKAYGDPRDPPYASLITSTT